MASRAPAGDDDDGDRGAAAAASALAPPATVAVTGANGFIGQHVVAPTVRGATAVLEAAARLGSVRRVVHTASFACVYDAAAGPRPDKTYTARDWSPLTYRAAKAAAERAARDWMAAWAGARPGADTGSDTGSDPGLAFDLVSLCPAMVFGLFLAAARPPSLAALNTSNLLVWAAVSPGRHAPVWVDVRDVALCHRRALEVAAAAGRRLLLARGIYYNQELAHRARALAPPEHAHRVPLGCPGRRERHRHFAVGASDTERLLGVAWRGLDDCLADLLRQLFEIERAQLAGV